MRTTGANALRLIETSDPLDDAGQIRVSRIGLPLVMTIVCSN